MINAFCLNLFTFHFGCMFNNLTKLQIAIVMRDLIEDVRKEEKHTMTNVKYSKLQERDEPKWARIIFEQSNCIVDHYSENSLSIHSR